MHKERFEALTSQTKEFSVELRLSPLILALESIRASGKAAYAFKNLFSDKPSFLIEMEVRSYGR